MQSEVEDPALMAVSEHSSYSIMIRFTRQPIRPKPFMPMSVVVSMEAQLPEAFRLVPEKL